MINLDNLKKYLQNNKVKNPNSIQRLLHGRGQAHVGLEELTIDLALNYVLMDFYGPQEEEEAVLAMIREYFPDYQVLWQNRKREKNVWFGGEPKNIIVTEWGLDYELRLCQTQNYGLFLDTAVIRQSFGQGILWPPDNIPVIGHWLNLFSYTGSLSVALLKGGASSVLNVDMKQPFLDWSIKNHALNQIDKRSASHLKRDVMDFKPRSGQMFSGIICDPPHRQRQSFDSEKQYPKLLKKMLTWLLPNGYLIATHNDPMISNQSAIDMIKIEAPELELVGTYALPQVMTYRRQEFAPGFFLYKKVL